MSDHSDLNNPEIMTATDTARWWEKAPDYVRQALRSTPARFPDGSVKLFGRQFIVTCEVMEAVKGHAEIQ